MAKGDSLDKDESTCETRILQRNSTVTSTLTTTDCALDDGTFLDLWTFDAFAGETITVDLRSDAFDTFLFLLDPAQEVVAVDDDGGEGLNSRIEFTLHSNGPWFVVVNNLLPVAGDPGNYSLTLSTQTRIFSRPAAGSGNGRDEMRWRDILEVCNTGDSERSLRFDFTERGAPGQARHTTTETIGPHWCRTFDDPILDWFGREMYGALFIEVDAPTQDVKIGGAYRSQRDGTPRTGTFDAISIEEAIRDDAYLLTTADRFSSSIGAGFQIIEDNTRFAISIESPIGTVHWQSDPISGEWHAGDNHLLGRLEQLVQGEPAVAIHYHVEAGALIPYGAVIEGETADPTIHLAAKPTTFTVIPAFGRSTGHGGIHWRGEFVVANMAAEICTVRFTLFLDRRLTGELTLLPREVVGLGNPFHEIVWHENDGSIVVPQEGVGPLEIRADREIIVDGRVHAFDPVTLSARIQAMRALNEPNLVPGKSHYFLGARDDGPQNLVRARLAFANMGKSEATVEVLVRHQNGSPAGWFSRTAPPWSLSMWRLPEGITDPGRTYTLEVTTSDPGYGFLSQIDSGNDPSTLYPF